MKFAVLICTTIFGFGQAKASDLKIVADIAPIGSIVSMISGHNVTVLIEPGQSPHDASLKPSMASALQNADVVIWMGEAMAPGLVKPIAQLAGQANVLELLEIEGIDYLQARETASFVEEHSDDNDDHHHDHEGIDPHAWLSPAIVQQWGGEIQSHLAKSAPENALEFETNLRASNLVTQQANLPTSLYSGHPVAALHDAFQYLEQSSGLKVIGAVSAADGTAPSAARLSDLSAAVAQHAPLCLISDAAETGDAARRMAQTLGLKLVPLDILGARQEQGPGLYHAMMKQIASDLKDCL
jgi:zinc transport system substrate-binding protein